MNAKKLFFIGLAVVAVFYFIAVGGNARHGDESPSGYKTEEQQTALANQYKSGGLQTIVDWFDAFASKIDLFAEIDNNNPPSQDRCKVVGPKDQRAVVLSENDASCQIFLSPSDKNYRKTTLSFSFDPPGTATRGGSLRPLAVDKAQLKRLQRPPSHRVVTATAQKLQVTLKAFERPSKPGVTEIRAHETLKITVQEKGGLLELTCKTCIKPIYVRAD